MAYVSATTPRLINQMADRLELYEVALSKEMQAAIVELQTTAQSVALGKPLVFDSRLEGAELEDHDLVVSKSNNAFPALLSEFFGNNPAIVHDDDFDFLVEKLPLIARNHLNNGESKNLWYEEVIPRETRFFTLITKEKPIDENGNEDKSLVSTFDDILHPAAKRAARIQIGANATVGYGQTLFHPLKSVSHESESK